MKTTLLVAGGLLGLCAWQANAQGTDTHPAAGAQTAAEDSQSDAASSGSMPGALPILRGKTREEVYEELVRSQHNGEAERIQELYKGS